MQFSLQLKLIKKSEKICVALKTTKSTFWPLQRRNVGLNHFLPKLRGLTPRSWLPGLRKVGKMVKSLPGNFSYQREILEKLGLFLFNILLMSWKRGHFWREIL